MRRIEIPVYTRTGPKIHVTADGAYVNRKNGGTRWVYQSKKVTGKGIFICATARSATVYTTELLKALGYDVGHEVDGPDGSVGYHLAVIRPKNCFHQVRHPLKQIASMRAHGAWGFMQDVVDINGTKLLGCMQYWLFWNELIEEFAVWRYRIEDLPNIWSEFLERIDHHNKYEPLPDIPRDINSCAVKGVCERHRFTELLTWNDLFKKNRKLAQRIKDKCLEYGYTMLPQGQSKVCKAQETTLV